MENKKYIKSELNCYNLNYNNLRILLNNLNNLVLDYFKLFNNNYEMLLNNRINVINKINNEVIFFEEKILKNNILDDLYNKDNLIYYVKNLKVKFKLVCLNLDENNINKYNYLFKINF